MIYNVSFPKLGINLRFSPVAIDLGAVVIRWYGVIIAFGFALALTYVLARSESFGIKKSDTENVSLLATVSAIVFARIYYVIFYPGDFYLRNPLKIFSINEGGIAIYGAVIGGFLAILIYCKVKKKDFLSVLDLMSLGLLIGQAVGRWGNFMNQEAFGCETSLPWGMVSEKTGGIMVHPCFLYESLGCLLCFVFLHFYTLRKKHTPGKIFLIYTAYYGILRALIESLRTDSLMIHSSSIRVSQVLGLVLAAISLLIIKFKYKTSRS